MVHNIFEVRVCAHDRGNTGIPGCLALYIGMLDDEQPAVAQRADDVVDGDLDEVGLPRGYQIARLGIDLIGTRSDYGPFRDHKVPFLFFSTGEHPDYHTPQDVPERIDYEQVAAVSSLVFRLTHSAANATEPPQWNDNISPRMEEVVALNSICQSLLDAGEKNPLTDIQKFIVKQAEQKTRQVMLSGKVTASERKMLIHTAQILLLSVF